MKKLALALSTLFAVVFSFHTLAGGTPGALLNHLGTGAVTPNPDVQSNSKFKGKSLDSWVESYIRWLYEGAAIPGNSVEFLPIFGDAGDTGNFFEIEVKPGTALVLPIGMWIGFPGDPVLGPDAFYGDVTLDGQPIAVPNENYYVGPTDLDPPIILDFGGGTIYTLAFYEGLAVVIKPLTPGEHTIQLYSAIDSPEPPVGSGLLEFANTWIITITP